MGANTLPGTPVIVNNGKKATTMMVVAKKIGRPTSRAARMTYIDTGLPVDPRCAR